MSEDDLAEKYRRDLAVRLCESEAKLIEVTKAFKRYADHEADCQVEYEGNEKETCTCFYLKKYYEFCGEESDR